MVNLTDSEKPELDEAIVLESPQAEEKSDFITPEEAAMAEKIDTKKAAESQKPDQTSLRSGNKCKRFFATYWAKKKWTIPVTILAIIVALLIIPFTRYAILGLFVKSQVQVTVVDSKTGKPVSSATVSLKGQSLKTDGRGVATGKVPVGSGTLQVAKQYYTTTSKNVTVTLVGSHNTLVVVLAATGRQVPIQVTNRITGTPLDGVTIKVLNTEAKTDKNGTAVIVLPTTNATQPVTISLSGYNTLTTNVQVTDQVVAANSFSLTPAGKLYFLSNQSGNIDVVKTNLDGTDRQVVLAGTGNEDPNSTSLLASRDWKYLALLAKRGGNTAAVYLIDTSTDKLSTIDSGNADFSFIGWSDDSFVYETARNNYQSWQSGAVSLKSFNAQTGKLITLDTTNATGTSNYDAKYEALFSNNVQFVGDTIVYSKLWYTYPGYINATGQQNTLNAINADGTDKKVVASQDATVAYFGTLYQYKPDELVVQVSYVDNSPATYYEYKSDGSYAKDTDSDNISALNSSIQTASYRTYLQSPSGKQTFWSDQRDGKNALFVGDANGQNEKQIADLSEYTQYGWYTDRYLLVSKNSSELYILPADGSTAPQKITDYYKPPINYRGYGGGYGGL